MPTTTERRELHQPPIDRELPGILDRLRTRFPWIPADEVEAAVGHEVERLRAAPVQEFTAIFVERAAATELGRRS